MTLTPTHQLGISTPKFLTLATVILAITLIFVGLFINSLKPTPPISTISREGVIKEIQQLSRLQSVAFSVDTIITANKTGTWQKLWQDEQKGLFIARGRVLAGIDLSNIRPEMVQVTHQTPTNSNSPHTTITITLPPSEVFEVFLDDIHIYDWQTGLFGIIDNDPEVFAQAQATAKDEVLNKACAGDIMALASQNASEQVKGLFMLTGATVNIHTQGSGACRL